jgi:hypothetical protein
VQVARHIVNPVCRVVDDPGGDLLTLGSQILPLPMQSPPGLGNLVADPVGTVIDLCSQTLSNRFAGLVQLVLNRAGRIVEPFDRSIFHVVGHFQILVYTFRRVTDRRAVPPDPKFFPF